MIKSQERFQFTLKGVRYEASIEMTIHTLVVTVDRFSCHCNSIHILSVNCTSKNNLILSLLLLRVYINCYIFNAYSVHFIHVQQCIQISTRINSSMYICTSVFVSFETITTHPMQFNKGMLNPIFNMVSE